MTVKLNRLRGEIDADPLTRGYAGMTDAQVASSLNAADRTLTFRADIEELERFVHENLHSGATIWSGIHGASVDDQHAAHGLCVEVIRILDRLQSVNLADVTSQALLDGLLAAGLCSSTHKTSVTALSQQIVSRNAELQIWHHDLPEHAVTSARAL